ncbi:ROP guanine nucleotide exchange factor 5 [Actinidia rufa]|uniref:ROP guanine nucleotide exchange factor 5 n=1 Tax=Actinidia rufa TaxID=165716 RepID=A0A7J0F1P2_9ERIC|nr:ROP guanine nucleotide exchange factor 5 [Actinidia rufa]
MEAFEKLETERRKVVALKKTKLREIVPRTTLLEIFIFPNPSHKYNLNMESACEGLDCQFDQDVGQSILESYSRVMENLAFNIMARIDDILYVDDATKRCDTAESMSVFSRGGLGGLPVQKWISPCPFSVQHTPYASPFATPTFCSSPALVLSPGRAPQLSDKNGLKAHCCLKLEKQMPAELQKLWSFAGNLASRRVYADSSEFD